MRKLILALALLTLASCRAQTDKPAVSIVYSPSLDSVCAFLRGGKIKTEWAKELADSEGVESFETRFEQQSFDYLDPNRDAVA